MNREIHVRFWEGLGVRFPRATHFPSLEFRPIEFSFRPIAYLLRQINSRYASISWSCIPKQNFVPIVAHLR